MRHTDFERQAFVFADAREVYRPRVYEDEKCEVRDVRLMKKWR